MQRYKVQNQTITRLISFSPLTGKSVMQLEAVENMSVLEIAEVSVPLRGNR